VLFARRQAPLPPPFQAASSLEAGRLRSQHSQEIHADWFVSNNSPSNWMTVVKVIRKTEVAFRKELDADQSLQNTRNDRSFVHSYQLTN
jgi:hypothetical protein